MCTYSFIFILLNKYGGNIMQNSFCIIVIIIILLFVFQYYYKIVFVQK